MIIGIDGNEANVERRVGIGEYAFELLKQFKKIQDSPLRQGSEGQARFKIQVYLKNSPLPHMPEESENWKYIVFGPKKLWTQFALPVKLALSIHRPDVFFTPSHYAPRFSFIPTAISVMDLSYLHFPDLFAKHDLYQLTHWTAYSVRQAKKIFTISEASKNDIIKYYQVKPENVIVTYPGIKEISNIKYQMSNIKLPKKYILFVGTLQPRKNIGRLIEAFSEVAKTHTDTDLVIVGKKGWLYESILSSPQKYNIVQKVHFFDFVSDKDLPAFYENALFFILPSLYEGFGLPVLEAMQYGCPVITSNVSSLPEAGGDACLYVDPENVSDIVEKMTKLLEDDTLRKDLAEKGKKHVKNFSWEKTAHKTLEVLEKIASS